MTQAAVLTGDLIGSTEAGPEATDRAMEELRRALFDITLDQHLQPTKFTRYRGDGWQALVVPEQLYLRVATHLLASLRKADIGLQTRIGIGIGNIRRFGTTDLSDAVGSAFIHSAAALDTIVGSDFLAIEGPPAPEIAWHRSGIETLNYLAGRWSKEQAEAISWRVPSSTGSLHALAEILEISRQALSSRLAVAGEKPIMAAIRAAEATL